MNSTQTVLVPKEVKRKGLKDVKRLFSFPGRRGRGDKRVEGGAEGCGHSPTSDKGHSD